MYIVTGELYPLSGKLTKTIIIQGEKFVSDSKGKTLQRISKGMYLSDGGKLVVSQLRLPLLFSVSLSHLKFQQQNRT